MFLRQSTAQTVRIGPFIDDTDFVSEEVALTISAADIRLSKDGGNMVSCSVGATHDEVGYYSVALGTGDTNTVGMLDVMVSETGTLWVKDRFYVLEEAVYDAMFGASAALNVGTCASVTGAVGSVTGAVGSVTGSVASVTGSVGSVIAAVSTVLSAGELVDLYQGGVWFETATGVAGTTVGTHGMPQNPSDVFADAVTLAGSTGLKRIFVVGDIVGGIFPTAGVGSIEVLGVGTRPVIDMNSQTFTVTAFRGCTVQGVAVSSALVLRDCALGAISGAVFDAYDCVFNGGDITLDTWQSSFYRCDAKPVGGSPVTIDFAINASRAIFRKLSGEIKLENMDATNVVDVEGTSTVTIDVSCTGGTLTVRGDVTVVDNAAGAVTVVHVSGVNLTQINGETAPLTKFQAILDTTISGVITSGGGSTTSFDSTSIPTTNDGQLVDKVGVFTDGPAKFRGFVVRSYTDATKTLVVDTLNVAPATGNAFLIFA